MTTSPDTVRPADGTTDQAPLTVDPTATKTPTRTRLNVEVGSSAKSERAVLTVGLALPPLVPVGVGVAGEVVWPAG